MRRSAAIALGLASAGLGLYLATRSRMEIMNVFASKGEFIRRIWLALGIASAKLGLTDKIGTVQKTILTGQSVHESGWGAARASKHAFNYWNLTAGKKWKGPILLGPDTEFSTIDDPKTPIDETKVPKKITQKFRKYGSDEESAIDILRFIGPKTRYAKAWDALLKGDTMLYAEELRKAGFFSQPLPLYQEGLRKGIQTVVQTLG